MLWSFYHGQVAPLAAMGGSASKLNVVICGLDNSGKTTMLYHMRLKEPRRDFKPTNGEMVGMGALGACCSRPWARIQLRGGAVHLQEEALRSSHVGSCGGEAGALVWRVERSPRLARTPHAPPALQLRPLWPNFYNNMAVDAVFFVIDAHDRTKMPEGAPGSVPGRGAAHAPAPRAQPARPS